MKPIARATRAPLPRGMNRTESSYALELEARKHAGEIAEWYYEAVTFKLGNVCRYTPDFLVVLPDGRLELHEVKGHWRDDAKVKLRVAADKFPFTFKSVQARAKKDGGGFAFEAF